MLTAQQEIHSDLRRSIDRYSAATSHLTLVTWMSSCWGACCRTYTLGTLYSWRRRQDPVLFWPESLLSCKDTQNCISAAVDAGLSRQSRSKSTEVLQIICNMYFCSNVRQSKWTDIAPSGKYYQVNPYPTTPLKSHRYLYTQFNRVSGQNQSNFNSVCQMLCNGNSDETSFPTRHRKWCVF